jgi:hypothetical protein
MGPRFNHVAPKLGLSHMAFRLGLGSNSLCGTLAKFKLGLNLNHVASRLSLNLRQMTPKVGLNLGHMAFT